MQREGKEPKPHVKKCLACVTIVRPTYVQQFTHLHLNYGHTLTQRAYFQALLGSYCLCHFCHSQCVLNKEETSAEHFLRLWAFLRFQRA